MTTCCMLGSNVIAGDNGGVEFWAASCAAVAAVSLGIYHALARGNGETRPERFLGVHPKQF